MQRKEYDFVHELSLFMTYDLVVIRVARRVPRVEQEVIFLPEHPSSSPVLSGVCVARSLVFCVCFVDHCLSFSV